MEVKVAKIIRIEINQFSWGCRLMFCPWLQSWPNLDEFLSPYPSFCRPHTSSQEEGRLQMMLFLNFVLFCRRMVSFTISTFGLIIIIVICLTVHCSMNFDGLDDDLDIGYTPTIATSSRSAGMKKLNRKTETKPTPVVTKKQDDFDMLDDLLASPVKPLPSKSVEKAKPVIPPTTKNSNEIDSFFDEPTLPIAPKNTNKTEKLNTTIPAKTNISSIPHLMEDNILEQTDIKPSMSFKFKQPDPIVSKKTVKEEQPEMTVSPSLRMMKPPLRKRQSKDQLPKPSGIGLSLPEQPQKSTQSVAQEDNKFNSVNLGNKRRSSIEMTTPELSLTLDNKINLNKNPTNQQFQSSVLPNANTNSQGKSSNLFISFESEKPKEYNSYQKKQQLTLQAPKKIEEKKPSWQPEKSYEFKEHKNKPNQVFPNKIETKPQVSQEEIEKQIQFVKRSYQKHIDSLQKNLEEQIKVNKDSRERLMREANTMIENQRDRMRKVHEEETDRIKQMNEWEKKKIEENYKYQIQSLKLQIQKLSTLPQNPKQNNSDLLYNDRKEIEYLEEKLRAQRKMVEERIKILDKRELEVEQREKEFNKRKRMEQDRLRNQQKRILQYEMDAKKQILNQKRSIEEQKQSIATQMATIEMGHYKRTQNMEQQKSQISFQKAEIMRERNQIRNLNNNLIIEYQKKCEELKAEKNKVAKLELDLINKIKVVEGTRQRLNTTNPVNTTHAAKENNWVNVSVTQNRIDDQAFKKTMSMEKMSQQKKLEGTQNRFMEMAANLKENMKIGKKGKQFDLDGYLMSMAHYTRSRQPIQ